MTGHSVRTVHTDHTVHMVVPAGIDDPRRPSGGNVYDRRLRAELARSGWAVQEHAVPGAWPRPDAAARAGLAGTLAGLPDAAVVLVDGLVGCAAPGQMVPAAARLRLVALVHMPLGGEGEAAVLRACAGVVTTSAWSRDLLVARYGLHPGDVVAAEPGVDPAAATRGSPGGGRLLCVGAVTGEKGLDVLVAALEAVAELAWDCRCVGSLDVDPGFVLRLRRRLDAGPASGRVDLAGARTGAALEAAYRDADLLVLPSRAETYGMVVTEALAHGVPVVATCVGGVPAALGTAEGAPAGMLVPPGDPGALAGALRRWLSDPLWRDGLRRGALVRRRTLRRWDATAAEVSAVLARVSP